MILLDLNHTLVENSHETAKPFPRQLAAERYRLDLVQWCRNQQEKHRRVILITARPEKYRDATLERIAALCEGWKPTAAHFNDEGLPPPSIKASLLDRHFRLMTPGRTLAIESNPRTRNMYSRRGIRAITYNEWCAILAADADALDLSD